MNRIKPFQILCGVGVCAIFSSTAAKSPVLPLFANSLGASKADIGFIAAASTAALVSELAKAGSCGAALGTMSTIMDVGQASGPVIAGLLIGTWGYGVGFPAIGLALGLACVVFLLAVRLPAPTR